MEKDGINYKELAVYDKERKGIFIHKNQLDDNAFQVGDRFSIKQNTPELFSIALVKNDKGDIIFDKNGIFIPRNRRVDILLGGIFDEYLIETNLKKRPKIILRPLEGNKCVSDLIH